MNDPILLVFHKKGLHTSIQDLGRQGYQHLGVPSGGVMDRFCAQIANDLVENEPNTPVLEVTLMGPEIEFTADCQIAMTGADLNPTIDGIEAPMYETISVKGGSVLFYEGVRSGCRTYLAVRGAWEVPIWLGSSSACSSVGAGLVTENIMKRERTITVHPKPHIPEKVYPKANIPGFPPGIRVSVLRGPEFELFPDEVVHNFFKQPHRVTLDSNRMGCRLETVIPDYKPLGEIISSGIVPGTIQITGSGKLIILLADAQTTGGYPRLANIITSDLRHIAQLMPGYEVTFSLIE